MSFEKVNEVPFTLRRRQRSKLGQYWATMGFIFQILRDIHPQLKILIDTMTLIGIVWSVRTGLNLFLTVCGGEYLSSPITSFFFDTSNVFFLNRLPNPYLVPASKSQSQSSLRRMGCHHRGYWWNWTGICQGICSKRTFPYFDWEKWSKVEQIKTGIVSTD